ncbi:PAS domain S-box protein [uncultured Desulfosarcina sp.]|uniref:PAS domain S-box protein n=1 Tax=uncultured Desulfosarcina sp. TaxID=218289 RepID=UPI0029C91EBF|nr:PAS domain S-box protein [uncultured Desulfosarcina sp.]
MPNKPTYEELERRVRELEKSNFEFKGAEKELREREALFRNLFEHHSAVQLIIDADSGNLIDANDAAVEFYGWTKEELQQMKIHDINTLPPEEIKQTIENVRTKKQIYFEFHHRLMDGTIRDVEVFSSKIQAKGKDLLHSVIHDITARKQAEKALRKSEESFSQLFESAPVPMGYAINIGGYKGTTWNDAWYRTFGYSREQVDGRSGNDIGLWFNPEDRSRFIEMANRQNYVSDFEALLRCRDGAIRNCSLFGRFIDKADHRLLMVVYLDITDRKRAEETLRFTQFAIDHMADAAFWMTPEARFFYVNQAACRALGYSREELMRMSVADIDPEFPMEAWPQIWNEMREKKHLVLQTSHRAKDGHVYPVEIQANFVEVDGCEYNCTFARDITVRKRVDEDREKLQSQLNQAQKMESVGRLAGGVAHDFNNMLGAILGYTELGMMKVRPTDSIHGTLREIQKAAQRSVDLTRQLLAFARKQTVAPKVFDLNDALESMLKMLRRLIGEDIDLVWLPGKKLGRVRIDPSQIEQLLANLCVNARDAIRDTGKIIVETGVVTFDETFCEAHAGFVPGEYILLAVSDNGCGMDVETVSHVFEPFFTTKEVGKGTGLGLATVYGMVKQNNGFINVYSEPGQGTTFKIYLPRHATEAGRRTKTDAAQPAERGHETILLVEDESMIMDITKTMLELQGYTVHAAATPGEAIRLAQEHTGEIHLLITDVVMPELNGRDLAKRLQSLYPNLKRLFMSGYTANVIAHHGVLDEGVHFIQKPFSMRTLAVKVREVLDETK